MVLISIGAYYFVDMVNSDGENFNLMIPIGILGGAGVGILGSMISFLLFHPNEKDFHSFVNKHNRLNAIKIKIK